MTKELKIILIVGVVSIGIFFLGFFLGLSTNNRTNENHHVSQNKNEFIDTKDQALEVIQKFVKTYYTDDTALAPKKVQTLVTTGCYEQLKSNAQLLKQSNYYATQKNARVKNIKIYMNQSDFDAICTIDIQKVLQSEQGITSNEINMTEHQSIFLQYVVDNNNVRIDNISSIRLEMIKEGIDNYAKED